MKESVLWGHKPGQDEDIITDTTSPERLAAARAWAIEQGYTGLRVQLIDGSRPDFIGALNITRQAR